MPIGVDSNGSEIKAAGLFTDGQLLKASLAGAQTDAAVELPFGSCQRALLYLGRDS